MELNCTIQVDIGKYEPLLSGSQMRELSFLKGSLFHVYGLVVFDHLLFYSDWYTTGVYMVDMITGHQEPVAQHLSRPTSLVIYHPANLTGEPAALFSTHPVTSPPSQLPVS